MKLYGSAYRGPGDQLCFQARADAAAARAQAERDTRLYPSLGPHIPVEIDLPDEWFARPDPKAAPAVRRLDQ